MEILTTSTSYGAAILLTIIFGAILLVAIVKIFTEKEVLLNVLSGIIGVLAISFLFLIWSDPAYVTYDAIVTDWNEVYEQGYEVVETNGKIVTLRKVGD